MNPSLLAHTGILLTSMETFMRTCYPPKTLMSGVFQTFHSVFLTTKYHHINIRITTALNIFKIVDQRIKFYSQITNLLPLKPKSTFRHLKQDIQDFHRKYVLVPADKAANIVVVV